MDAIHLQIDNEDKLAAGFAVRLAGEFRARWSGWLVISLGTLCVLLFVFQLFGLLEPQENALLGDLATTTLASTSVLLAWRVTRNLDIASPVRRAWQLLLLSFFVYACGEGLWLFFSKVLGIEPFPSWADVGYLLFYPLMLWALISFPTARNYSRSDKLKLAMDITIVMTVTTVAVWYFIVNPTLVAASEDEWLKPVLAVSYVVGDIVMLLGVVTVLVRGISDENRKLLYIIISGLAAFAVGDLGFAYLTAHGLYVSGHWIDNFWMIGDFALVYSAHFQLVKARDTAPDEEAAPADIAIQPFSWLPYCAVVAGFGLLVFEASRFWSEPLGVVLFAALGTTAMVIVRQIAAVKENVRLLEEKSVRQSELRFETLVENSSDLITILDESNVVLYESPSLKNVLGYEAREVIGKRTTELIHPDDLALRLNVNETLLAEPQSIMREEIRFKHKDGSWRVLETVSRYIDDRNNNLKGILVNSRDVTERKKDEEKLKLYTKKLERSNRELQDFAYVASHDLQEPLRKVQAFGDRLEKKHAESLAVEARDYIKRMRDASSRMQNLINDLLTFSRVTTKTQPFVPTLMSDIAREVVSDLEVRIEQTNAVVEIGELPEIDADPVQMRQLVQNLIGNALKFQTADSRPHVKIFTESTEEPSCPGADDQKHLAAAGEGFCLITVEDNGIGFEEKYIDRIFTVFQRLHGRSEYEGSGIGLAVCRKIVERHSGTITAQSEPGKGSRFTIALPIRQSEGEITS